MNFLLDFSGERQRHLNGHIIGIVPPTHHAPIRFGHWTFSLLAFAACAAIQNAIALFFCSWLQREAASS